MALTAIGACIWKETLLGAFYLLSLFFVVFIISGNVYHLYTQRLYSLFDDFEMSEVKRQPMTEVALRLKSMLRGSNEQQNENEDNDARNINVKDTAAAAAAATTTTTGDIVTQEEESDSTQKTEADDREDQENQKEGTTSITAPIITSTAVNPLPQATAASLAPPLPLLPSVTSVLLSLIEPPSLQSIHAALHTLHSYGMLTSSTEHSKLTEIGTLAADLPVDFMLGRFIGYAGMLVSVICIFVLLLSDLSMYTEL